MSICPQSGGRLDAAKTQLVMVRLDTTNEDAVVVVVMAEVDIVRYHHIFVSQ